MKKIRIAFIIDSINTVAGTEKQLIQMINHLGEHGYLPVLICLRKPSAAFEIEYNIYEYIELGIKRLFSLKAFGKFIWLVSYLRRRKFDIIQTYFFDATMLGIPAGKIAGVKNLISCRRDLGFWHSPKLLAALKLPNFFTTRILVNSEEVKKYTSRREKISASRIDVIRNGIDTTSVKPVENRKNLLDALGLNNEHYLVGIVANLNRPVKRVDVFIKATALVLKKIPEVSFLVVGDGYLREELGQLARDLGVKTSLHFLGRRTDIYSVISCWDIGVIASDSEGFSNSILEYMAIGVPAIATQVGGNKEIIKHNKNGLLVRKGDPWDLAEKICSLLEDEQIRHRISSEAKLVIEKEYVWQEKIKEIETYYRKLVNAEF